MPSNCPNPFGATWQCDKCPKYQKDTIACGYHGCGYSPVPLGDILETAELNGLLIRRQLAFERGDLSMADVWTAIEHIRAMQTYQGKRLNEHLDNTRKAKGDGQEF